MNKLFTGIAAVSMSLAMSVGVGVAVSRSVEATQVNASTGSLVMSFDLNYNSSGTGTSCTSDAGEALTTANFATKGSAHYKISGHNYYWIMKEPSYITRVDSTDYCYAGKDSALKIGKKNNAGTLNLTMNIPETAYISSVVINAHSNKQTAPLSVAEATNATKNQTVSTTAKNYTFTYANDTSRTLSITGGSSAQPFVYASTITVNYVVPASVTSISVSGTLTKKAYTTAETFDHTGLTVTATRSDSTTADVTNAATYTWYNMDNEIIAGPGALGVGENQTIKVVATYDGVSNDNVKYHIPGISVTDVPGFKLVTDPSKLTQGTTFMLVGYQKTSVAETTKAMKITRSVSNGASQVTDVSLTNGFNPGSIATSDDATVFTLAGAPGSWIIENGSNKLGFTGTSNNNMQFNEDMDDSFNISLANTAKAAEDFKLKIASANQPGRFLQYNQNDQNSVPTPRFSNYGGGQQYVYMFAEIAEQQFGTVDHISVTTTPDAISWHVGEEFTDEGLHVVAWDGADESVADSEIIKNYTSSLAMGYTFQSSDIGPKEITISYTEDDVTYQASYSIYIYPTATYELVTSAPSDWSGTYLIAGEVETSTAVIDAGTYVFVSDLFNFDVLDNDHLETPVNNKITCGENYAWTIETFETGYSLRSLSGKYIGYNTTATSNGLFTSDEPILNNISMDEDGHVLIANTAETTRYLSLSSSSGQFRYYKTTNTKLYKLSDVDEASEYANTFLSTLKSPVNPVCDASGSNTDISALQPAWESLANAYSVLSAATKLTFKQGSGGESTIVEKAIALYDLIASKYNTSLESETLLDYDFMDRGVTANNPNALINKDSGEVAIPAAVITFVTSLSLFGLFFYIRKRKII